MPHGMKLMQPRTQIVRAAIVLFAILLGIAMGVLVVPVTLVANLRHGAVSGYELIVGMAIAFALIEIDLVILKVTSDRKDRLDSDLLDAFLEHIPDNIFFKDRNSRFIRISKAMANYCGLKNPSDAFHKTDADIFSAEHADQAFADEQKVIETGQPLIATEEKETWPDGHETWVVTTKVPLNNRRGEVLGTMGISHDITDRKQAELRIQHMTLHDGLTGLPNRALVEDRLSQAIALALRNEKHVGVLMLDVDRFKSVIDCFGYDVGDRLLEAVASRLKTCLRESDTIGRLGGDEFAMVLPMAEGLEGIECVAQKVLEIFTAPFRVEKHELQMSASVGLCQFPEDGRSAGELLQLADAAMYEAKTRGRGKYCVSSPDLASATLHRQKMENDLFLACARDEFELHYQPIVETMSSRIAGVEALLRWRHPELGLISPSQFIPQLEEMGMMVGVGRWVLMTACRQAVDWQRNGLPGIRMAVNVSAQQFYHGNIVDTVASILSETRLDAKLLELELTESQTLDDSEATISIMRSLKRLGVSLSLDDFGTGWSSLS